MPLVGSGIDQVAKSVVEFSGIVRAKLVGGDGAVHKIIKECDTEFQ